ncbi:MAG: transcriptional regulator [Rhodothermia bacterium]|nr:transcriptional regulator [Rhodothermia bacterium]
MKPIKKIEIITPSIKLPELMSILDQNGIRGYTVIHASVGKGTRGLAYDDDLVGTSGNDYLFTLCTDEEVEVLVPVIKPLLVKYGGIFLISEVAVITR